MRFFLVLGILGLSASAGALASSSCVVATRDLPDGSNAGNPTPAVDAADAEFDCGCCARSVLPFLPNCSGHVAFAIPAIDCPRSCKKGTAYVMCDDECYSACGCILPDGYSLVDGGFDLEDAGADEAAEDARAEPGPRRADASDETDASDHGKDAGATDS